ncbi:hypothetical protein B0H10DRAFT_2225812 [Mycena sp. CBHHK59/15]|nr:hypothetical protein B0H10DRAFT_2225812 [Mycena sp. CBHHK59/15]
MAADKGFGTANEVIRIVVEPNTFVVLSGTALSLATQRVTVIREGQELYLTGKDNVLLYNDKDRYLSFLPVGKKTALILLFESVQTDSLRDSEYARDFKATKIHTEDGGDTDFHDTTLAVALIAAGKKNGNHDDGRESPSPDSGDSSSDSDGDGPSDNDDPNPEPDDTSSDSDNGDDNDGPNPEPDDTSSDSDNNGDDSDDEPPPVFDPYSSFTKRLQNITNGNWNIYPESIRNTIRLW